MEYFHNFILEAQTLPIKIVNKEHVNGFAIDDYPEYQFDGKKVIQSDFLNLSDFNQRESNYEYEIKILQQRAITDILSLNPKQIELHINRIKFMINNYKVFWARFAEQYHKFRNNECTFIDFQLAVYYFFIIPNKNNGLVSERFLHDLHDAAMFKEAYLYSFISEINQIIGFIDESTENTIKNNEDVLNYDSFSSIFAADGWQKYVDQLMTTEPPLLDKEYKFIGKTKGHTGVIANWFSLLQTKGIIKSKITRQQLAKVLNNEFSDFKMGIEGRIFNEESKLFREVFAQQLLINKN